MSASFAVAPVPELPPCYPIATAPRVDGVSLSPILLWDREWIIGYWSGGWREWLSGRPIEPTAWAPLPREPVAGRSG